MRSSHHAFGLSLRMHQHGCAQPLAAAAQKQKGSGLLSAPARQRCCARCPKPFTIFVATLVLALVLISGLMIGHFAVPYIRNMVSS